MCRSMSKTAINRQQFGLAIANIIGAVKRKSDSIYRVESQSGNGGYEVNSTDLGWVCSCPDHKFRGVKCKHIFAVEISFALHKEVEVARIEPVDIKCCIYCKSPSIIKDGLRYNKYGAIQKFNCRGCGRYFTINLGFEKMHATPQMITSALQLYFTGESFRNIQKFLRLQGVKMSHVAIYKWIKKYVGLMQVYLGHLGLDLKDSLSRFQIIVKVPYANLGDRWINARYNRPDGKKFYSWLSALHLVQAYGRSVRSETDWAITYILDSGFRRFVDMNRNILPTWFLQSIKW
jgi:transposase-like protein